MAQKNLLANLINLVSVLPALFVLSVIGYAFAIISLFLFSGGALFILDKINSVLPLNPWFMGICFIFALFLWWKVFHFCIAKTKITITKR
jgi:hypothetical protein